jgi:hypothetical protein
MEQEEYPQGAATLDATERWLNRFVHFPSDAHSTLTTLWVAGSHMTDETGTVVHKAYGRLGFVSDQPSSGKTTAMERALALTPRGETLVQPSQAGILDALEERATIGLDEADKYFGKTGRMPHVVALLNAGYKQGASLRHRGRKVNTFSLVMYSGLLEALGVNPDLAPLRTRSFLVEMVPAPLGTDVTEYDDERHDGVEGMLRHALASWGRSVAPMVADVVAEAPEGVHNRRAQLWRPLLRVAALAGGDWPERALSACDELESGVSTAEVVQTPGQRIMADVLSVCKGVDRIPTGVLLERLYGIAGAPWRFVLADSGSSGTARELAALLEPHGLLPKLLWFELPDVGRLQMRGYALTDHQGCGICPADPPHTDELDSHTDQTSLHTDEPVHVTDALRPPVEPKVRDPRLPSAAPMITFSG